MISDLSIAEALSPRALSLILLPTEKCNFRCTYCYEDFSIGRMQASVISGIKALLNNRIKEIDRLSISWFGGEPLLAKSVVLDIGSFAHNLCNNYGVNFQAGFTTNGYLLDFDLFKSLLRISHVDYQITLDGDEEWHNKTRVLANRKPTFDVIWSNLVSYKRARENFSITLRLHVHRDNVESLRRLKKRLEKEILDDPRFRIYFHKVSNLSSDFVINETVLKRDEYLSAINYISDGQQIQKAPVGAISEEHLDGYICYAAKPNSLMIRANGTIGKCTVALNDGQNSIGRIKSDGTLDIENEKLRVWMNGFATLSEKTLSCPLSELAKAG